MKRTKALISTIALTLTLVFLCACGSPDILAGEKPTSSHNNLALQPEESEAGEIEESEDEESEDREIKESETGRTEDELTVRDILRKAIEENIVCEDVEEQNWTVEDCKFAIFNLDDGFNRVVILYPNGDVTLHYVEDNELSSGWKTFVDPTGNSGVYLVEYNGQKCLAKYSEGYHDPGRKEALLGTEIVSSITFISFNGHFVSEQISINRRTSLYHPERDWIHAEDSFEGDAEQAFRSLESSTKLVGFGQDFIDSNALTYYELMGIKNPNDITLRDDAPAWAVECSKILNSYGYLVFGQIYDIDKDGVPELIMGLNMDTDNPLYVFYYFYDNKFHLIGSLYNYLGPIWFSRSNNDIVWRKDDLDPDFEHYCINNNTMYFTRYDILDLIQKPVPDDFSYDPYDYDTFLDIMAAVPDDYYEDSFDSLSVRPVSEILSELVARYK